MVTMSLDKLYDRPKSSYLLGHFVWSFSQFAQILRPSSSFCGLHLPR
ncbi:hypothetical protein [Chroococcidiopsis sp. SAG 2025]|nr:hypothetical protein [Chroococcidiopsis sp. SAG 2025]